jgi:hypothetical protein
LAQENTMRHLLALVLGCLISTSALAANVGETWREARIRPQDPRMTELLRDGFARSATFRALVNRIEASNLFVYVSFNPLMKANLAGKLTWMTRAGKFRYVRATINAEQNLDQMIATLAHELHHAVEVLEDDSVSDQRSLQELYKRIGRPSHAGANAAWETVAAQETGIRVRRELLSAAAAMKAARVTEFAQS